MYCYPAYNNVTGSAYRYLASVSKSPVQEECQLEGVSRASSSASVDVWISFQVEEYCSVAKMWRSVSALCVLVTFVSARSVPYFAPLSHDLVNYINKLNTTWQVSSGAFPPVCSVPVARLQMDVKSLPRQHVPTLT